MNIPMSWRIHITTFFTLTLLGAVSLGLYACSDDTTTPGQPDTAVKDSGPSDPDAATHDGTTHQADGATADTTKPQGDTAPPPADAKPYDPDEGPLPDFGTPINLKKVAAVQYGRGQAALVKASCATDPFPDVCALKELTVRARVAGAQLIVLPEYAIDQKYFEPHPTIGENPGTGTVWPADTLIRMFSITARRTQTYLVFDLLTYSGKKPNTKYYNTQIAYNPKGEVVAMHHKFELFGDERKQLTAGTDVTTFDTPLGKTGLLICADIYGSDALLKKLSNTLKAKVVAVSSFWTVNGAVKWYSTYAGKYKVYAIASNHTLSKGYGGGIYKPDGTALAEAVKTTPNIVFAEIP